MSDLAALLNVGSSGFRLDPRFAPGGVQLAPQPTGEDPVATAFNEGFAAGLNEARDEAEERAAIDAAARQGLALSLSRLDAQMAEELRQRLEETVIALCEATIAPIALDREALSARIDRAIAMFSRADDERVIRLNPEDVRMLAPDVASQWTILPDPALERGALRIETASGGVEDGPEQWRCAILEAVRAC